MGTPLDHTKTTSSSAASRRADHVGPPPPAKVDGAPDALKALARALARQAAREVFAAASAPRADGDASDRPKPHVAP